MGIELKGANGQTAVRIDLEPWPPWGAEWGLNWTPVGPRTPRKNHFNETASPYVLCETVHNWKLEISMERACWRCEVLFLYRIRGKSTQRDGEELCTDNISVASSAGVNCGEHLRSYSLLLVSLKDCHCTLKMACTVPGSHTLCCGKSCTTNRASTASGDKVQHKSAESLLGNKRATIAPSFILPHWYCKTIANLRDCYCCAI
ncbi:hypothetical protein CBL_00118 [Carabus blaptoides fortunei]